MAERLRRRDGALHPGLAGTDHVGASRGLPPGGPGVRRELRGIPGAHHDHHRRRHLPLVPRRRHLPLHHGAADADRLHRTQRRRLGPLRRPGEVPPHDRVVQHGQRAGLVASSPDDDRHRVLVHAHRPVAHRRILSGPDHIPAVPGTPGRDARRRLDGTRPPAGMDAVLPAVRPQPPGPSGRGPGGGRCRGSPGHQHVGGTGAEGGQAGERGGRHRRAAELAAHDDPVALQPVR